MWRETMAANASSDFRRAYSRTKSMSFVVISQVESPREAKSNKNLELFLRGEKLDQVAQILLAQDRGHSFGHRRGAWSSRLDVGFFQGENAVFGRIDDELVFVFALYDPGVGVA